MNAKLKKTSIFAGIMIALCFSIVAGYRSTNTIQTVTSIPNDANSTGNSDQSGDEWPMYRGRLTQNGLVLTSAQSGSAPVWTYTTDTSVFCGVAVANGYVYAPTANALYCFDANTGALVWKNISGVGFIDSCPAVAGGYVYIGTFGTPKFYCLNATTGWKVWDYTPSGDVHSSPAVAGGYVYFGDNGGGLTMLDAITGAFQFDYNLGSVQGSPTVIGGRVYLTIYRYVACVSATDLSEIWRITVASVGTYLTSTPAYHKSSVYVAAGSCLLNLRASDGLVQWNSSLLYPSGYGSPAVTDGYVYVDTGSAGNSIYCLSNSTGAIIWNTPLGGSTWSAPSLSLVVGNTPDKLYQGRSNGKLYCLNALTGAILWNYTTGARIADAPAITNGRVYFGSDDNKVYCLPMTLTQTPGGDNLPPPPPDIAGPALPFVMGVMTLAITAIAIRTRRRHL